MEIANVLVSLGGDPGNTVPKYNVTAAEIGVLLAIHGNDAVNEIEPVGEIKRRHPEERGRLLAIYGGAKNPNQTPIVATMFPGVAARVFETLSELGLDDSMFKATGRMTAPTAPVEESVDEAPAPAAEFDEVQSADEVDDDGIGDEMPDANEFKETPNVLG